MDNTVELKDVNKLKEINGNKPRASSTSEIESQLNQASTSTSEPKKIRTRIQFQLPGETTPLMIERDKSNEVSDRDTSSSVGEGAVVEKPEMSIVPSSHIERQTSEEDEEILEVLRRVVRSCTDADLSKRPSANEILDMLTKYIDQDDPLE